MSDNLLERLNDLAADKINLRSENMALKAKLSESEALLAKAVDDLEDMLTTPNSEAAQGILKAYVRHLIAELKGDNQ